VPGGNFAYYHLGPASPGSHLIDLRWWPSNSMAVFYVDGNPIADIQVTLNGRLFVQVEGDARLNGDSVNDTFSNATTAVGNQCPTYCGLNGSWNTSFSFYGLHATNTNGRPENGADFSVTGTVSGLPPGGTWDTNVVSGIAMIAQYWSGQ